MTNTILFQEYETILYYINRIHQEKSSLQTDTRIGSKRELIKIKEIIENRQLLLKNLYKDLEYIEQKLKNRNKAIGPFNYNPLK